jgi:mannan endo-1,4-beta-mannosidase
MYETAGRTNSVKSNIDGVINRNLALCIGEFGWYHGYNYLYQSNKDVDEDLILSYCKEKNVGWLAWSWYGNGGGVEYLDLVKAPGTDETKVNSPTVDGVSCNWGEKIINAWKAEADTCTVYLEQQTNIKADQATARITVYPTKAKDVVYVACPDSHYSVSVTDIGGRLISYLSATGETTAISCSNWAPGIYYISVITNSGRKTFPIIR